MESRGLLSKEQFEYYTSQKDTIANLSENNKRIAEKVEDCFTTMKIILDSEKFSQEQKDDMFKPTKISLFMDKLTYHNPENTNAQEVFHQQIIIDLIQKVFNYYQSRYKNQKFIIKQIMKFRELASDIRETAEDEKREDEASIMYKTRKLPTPPLIVIQENDWTALCMQCFSYSLLGKKEADAIRHIRHAVNCSFHKEWNRFSKKDRQRVINQFFKTTKPQKKP